MTKVYFFRHQAAGVLFDSPFSEPPSPEQTAALTQRCSQVHGFGHPKTPDQPYWVRVEEHELLDASSVIAIPETSSSATNAAGASEFAVSGVGKVE